MDIRDTNPQLCIDRGACLACRTFKAVKEGFCCFRCKDYYLFCESRLINPRWKTALKAAEEEFALRFRRHGSPAPDQIILSN